MQFILKRLSTSKKKLIISAIGVVALVLFTGWIIYETTKIEVVFADNGEDISVNTHANTVAELLEELGIEVGEHDKLSHDKQTSIENGMEISYQVAKQITVTVDGNEQTFYTTAETVGDFFEEEGLHFSSHDELSHEHTTLIENGLSITVDQAFPITVNNGGEEEKIWTTGGKVADILSENNITYNDLDKISPAVTEEVKEDTEISIVHVEKKTETIEEKVAFETEKKEDNSLEKGQERVVSEGKEGTVTKTYEITLENGKETNRELLNEEVIEESKNKVIAVGTKEKPKPVAEKTNAEKDAPSSSSKELVVTASAYTANCNGCSGYTATGINLKDNPNMKVVAVDPNVIPLGSKVWVEGYGTAIAADTGGSIQGNRIDAHFPSKQEAYSFGRKKVKIKILD